MFSHNNHIVFFIDLTKSIIIMFFLHHKNKIMICFFHKEIKSISWKYYDFQKIKNNMFLKNHNLCLFGIKHILFFLSE